MREIKFRAWNKLLHHMYYDEDNRTEPNLWNIKDFVSGGKLILNKSVILMQYTGLKDKYNNEIYEGDILKVKVGSKYEYMEVYFKDGYFGWGKEHNGVCSFDPFDLEDIEVVGNIYEDKELLNKNSKSLTR